MQVDLELAKKQAEEELEQEAFLEAVERAKEKLRTQKSFWKRIFPFKIVIVRR